MEPRLVKDADPLFLSCCKRAGIKPTQRQWRKWKRGEGRAKQWEAQVEQEIKEQQ